MSMGRLPTTKPRKRRGEIEEKEQIRLASTSTCEECVCGQRRYEKVRGTVRRRSGEERERRKKIAVEQKIGKRGKLAGLLS